MTSTWLPRVLAESALITVSILVALGIDEWRESRQDAEMQQDALSNFLVEIRQNASQVDYSAPFNQGLRQVVARHYRDEDIESIDQFISMVTSFSPAALQSTAWDTALATGSLAKMDYNLVTALSLTYGLQSRYQMATESTMGELTSPQYLADDKLKLAIYNSIRYLDHVIVMESELAGYYAEATLVIQKSLIDMGVYTIEMRDGSVANIPGSLDGNTIE